MAQIEVEGLSFTYPGCKGKALDSVDFQLGAGELCLLMGKSGSGKSTFLNLLKSDTAPAGQMQGEVKIGTGNVAILKQHVESNIINDTVFGELSFLPANMGLGRKEVLCKIAETANYFNLTDYVDAKTDSLSGGVKQILALACAMSAEPSVLLLDEPTSQLDPVSAELFINTVLKMRREAGITVIIIEHRADALLEEADKIALLDEGKMRFCLPPREAARELTEKDYEIKEILPSFTLALPGCPVSFKEAKAKISELKIKEDTEEENTKPEKALTAKSLAYAYEKGKYVLFSLNFTAYKGKINALVGANGTGKTTLLKCLASVLQPQWGKVKGSGKTAYLPQNIESLFLEETVREEAEGDDKLLQEFGLEAFAERSPFDLSVGEQQRLALLKVIKSGAEILLLDEPTKSIDAVFKKQLGEMLLKFAAGGKTVVLALHDLEFAAMYADYVSLIFNREIVCTEKTKKFFSMFGMYTTSLSRLTNGRAVSLKDIDLDK